MSNASLGEHDRVEAGLTAFYERQVDRIAEDLRRLAISIERRRQPLRSYVDEASWAVQDVMNAIPNLPFEALICAARDVDVYRSKNT